MNDSRFPYHIHSLLIFLLFILLFITSAHTVISLQIAKNLKPPPPIISPIPLSTSLFCTITAYTGNQCKNNKNTITSILEKPIAGGTCAVSRDLMGFLGGKVYIDQLGVFRVNDLMNERFTQSLDLYVSNEKQAYEFGKQTRQIVYLGGKTYGKN